MNIEVGEYIITQDRLFIGRVKETICTGYPIRKLEGYIVCNDEVRTILNPEQVKHSKNIIDLIEIRRFNRIK